MLSVPADQALSSGLNFLIVFAAARCMEVESFGMFSLVWAAVLFVTNVHFALYLNPMPVLLPEKSGVTAARYLDALHGIQQPFVWFVATVAVVVAMVGPWSSTLIAAGSLLAVTRSYLEHERRLGYAGERIGTALAADAVASIPPAATAVVAIVASWRIDPGEMLVYISAWAFAGYGVGRWLNRGVRGPCDRVDRLSAAREHWDYGKWALGSTLSLWGSSQAFPFILAAFVGLREVALFTACKGVLGLIHFTLQGFDAYFIPTLRRRLTQQGGASLVAGIKGSAVISLLAAGLPCLVIAAFPEMFLELFYGGKYLTGAWVLRTLALLYLLMVGARLMQVALHALKEPRPVFAASLVNTVMTLSLGIALVASSGMVGVLVAQGLNYIIDLVVVSLVVHKRIRRLLSQSDPSMPGVEAVIATRGFGDDAGGLSKVSV